MMAALFWWDCILHRSISWGDLHPLGQVSIITDTVVLFVAVAVAVVVFV